MSIFIGLNVSNYLSDVADQPTALRNINLNRADLDHIRGLQSSGLTRDGLHNLSGLNVDQEKQNFANAAGAEVVTRELLDTPTLLDDSNFNIRLDNQLLAGAIKYNYFDYASINSSTGEPTLKSADISTSRVSSWSQIGTGPIFYGADTVIKGDANNESVIDLENIVFTGELSAKRFSAEVPTHKITVDVNGQDRELFTMRNIPFRFEGNFNEAQISLTTNSNPTDLATIAPTVLFINQSLPDDNPFKEYPVTPAIPRTSSTNTIEYNVGAQAADVFIDIYYNPQKIERLWLNFGNPKSLRIREFPNVEMKELVSLAIENNLFPEMPNLFKITGGNDPSHTTNVLYSVFAGGNPFSTSGVSAQNQLKNYIPASLGHLNVDGCFVDSTPIDIRTLKASGTGLYVPAGLQLFSCGTRGTGGSNAIRTFVSTRTTNSVSPILNGNSLTSYYVSSQKFKYLPWDITHDSFDGNDNAITNGPLNNLTTLSISNNDMVGQLTASNDPADGFTAIQVPDSIVNIKVRGNELEAINCSGKANLVQYDHDSNFGFANPSGGIDGYFNGCTSLEELSFQQSYVTANIDNLFSGLPSLTRVKFSDTRLQNRMSSTSFVGTTNLASFVVTEGNFTSAPGATNFFGNDFVLPAASPPVGGAGQPYEGGYFVGTITPPGGQAYHLIVADENDYEGYDPRFIDMQDVGSVGNPDFLDGETNHGAEYAAGVDYLAAYNIKPPGMGSINGYSDWYIPSRDELELIYRTFKPTTDANAIVTASGSNNPASNTMVNGFTGPYTTTTPGQTNLVSYRGTGNQAFHAFDNVDGSTSAEILANPNFTNATNHFSTLQNGTTPNGVNPTISGNRLVVSAPRTVVDSVLYSSGATEMAGFTSLILRDGQDQYVLSKGSYDLEIEFAEVKLAEVDAGDFVSGAYYKILDLGSTPAFNNIDFSDFNQGSNTITLGAGHGLTTGTIVSYSEDGNVVDGFANLTSGSNYRVLNPTSTTIQLQPLGFGTAINIAQSPDQTFTFDLTSGDGNNYNFGTPRNDRTGTIADTTDPTIQIYSGDTITFDNNTGGHVLQLEDSSGNVIATESNGELTYNFTTAGTYYYQCVSHSSMRGQITVTARSGTFDIVVDRAANWQHAGASNVNVGQTFEATSSGIGIYSGKGNVIAHLGGSLKKVGGAPGNPSADSILDEVVVYAWTRKINNSAGGRHFFIQQGLTNSPTTHKATIHVPDGDINGVDLVIASTNVDYKINRISLKRQVGVYWSSTEGLNTVQSVSNVGTVPSTSNNTINKVTGMAQNFRTGEQVELIKNAVCNVRPVRKVYVTGGTSIELEGTSDIFQPCGNSLHTFTMTGSGKEVSTGFNIRGKMPSTNYLNLMLFFTLTGTQISGQMPQFSNANYITKIQMFDNMLEGAFTFDSGTVTEINVQNNEFTSASVIRCEKLSILNLADNNIGGVFPDMSVCAKLSKLYLQNNNIVEYQLGSLSTNTNITNVDLSNNNLTTGAVKRLLQDLWDNFLLKPAGRISPQINISSIPGVRYSLFDSQTKQLYNDLQAEEWSISVDS